MANDENKECELERKALIMALKIERRKYDERAQYYLKNQNDGLYLHWDNKCLHIDREISKVGSMSCSQLKPYAASRGMDLDQLVKSYYPFAEDEEASREMLDIFNTLVGDINQSIDLFANFENRINGIMGEWNSYLDSVDDYRFGYGTNPDLSLVYPWFEDPEKAKARIDAAIAKDPAAGSIEVRQPWVIDYEDAYFEYFSNIVADGGEELLCFYIRKNGEKRRSLLALESMLQDTTSQAYREWVVSLIQIETQLSAFRRLENWQDIRALCEGKFPSTYSYDSK